MASSAFNGLVIHPLSLQVEAFGACTNGCISDDCPKCARAKANWDACFQQPIPSIVLVPPGLYRKHFLATFHPVTFFTVLSAYVATQRHLKDLCDPQNSTLYKDVLWLKEAQPYREIAYPLWLDGRKDYDELLKIAFETRKHVDMLRAMESHICYGMAILDVMNATNGNVDPCEMDTLRENVKKRQQVLVDLYQSKDVMEWKDICKSDQYSTVLKKNESMNKEHKRIMEAIKKVQAKARKQARKERKKQSVRTEHTAST
jgi:hypothetical protein